MESGNRFFQMGGLLGRAVRKEKRWEHSFQIREKGTDDISHSQTSADLSSCGAED